MLLLGEQYLEAIEASTLILETREITNITILSISARV